MLARYFSVALLMTLFTASGLSAANPYYFQKLDINDGLSQNCVNAIMQDRSGFMWFGTRDGLNRYDGTGFKVFRNDLSDAAGLGNNFITSLYEDGNGNIWIGTDVGVFIYYPQTERFEEFSLHSGNGHKIEKTVIKIGPGRQGKILIAVMDSGLFEYDVSSGSLVNYDLAGKFGNIREFAIGDNGRLWVSFYGGLYYTDGSVEELKRYEDAQLRGQIISKIHFGSHNRIYLGSERGGVYEVNLITGNIRKLDLGMGDRRLFVRDIIARTDTSLWIGTEHGLYIYDLINGGYINLTSSFFDPYSISDNAIYSIFKDNEGGVWIGSFFGGINYYSDNDLRFDKYYPSTEAGSLTGRRIREICGGGDGSSLWIGTEDAGLFNFDMKSGRFEHFAPSRDFPNIHGLCMDGNDLWVGTFSNGVKVIDTSTGKIRSYSLSDRPLTIRDNYVFSICKTSTGHIYLGTANFLIKHDKTKGTFERIPELDNNLIYDIKEDSKGNLWVATYMNGLYLHNTSPGTWAHFRHSQQQEGSLPVDKILSIFEDSRKNIWITTQGGGFCRFLPDSHTFETFDTRYGLPNDVVFQIQEDRFGRLWLTTNKGLVEFDPTTGRVANVYTVADGLPGGQFNYKSSYKDGNGKIYFGTTEGMVSFDHNDMERERTAPPILITDFQLFNLPVPVGGKDSPLEKSITFSDKIALRHDQNTFSFQIAALDYRTPQSGKLAYTLEGVDHGWQSLPESSVINYSNLRHGKYLLRIRNTENDISQAGERVLKIDIKPPFYLTTVAYLCYLLLVLAVIYAIYTYIERRNRRRQQAMLDRFEHDKEKELHNSKINFFTNVTHEIRTPLTLIKGPLESVLSKNTVTDNDTVEELRIMKQNVDRLTDLTNQLLDFRQTERDSPVLNYVKCDVARILREIFERFSPLARQQGYRFTLNASTAPMRAMVDVEALTKIVSNLLTNAIKYGGERISVTLAPELTDDGGHFEISVENDGQPLPPDMKEKIFEPFVRYISSKNGNITGTGLGLPLARFLAEQHGGSLNVATGEVATRFTLRLPVEQKSQFGGWVSDNGTDIDFGEPDSDDTHDERPTVLVVEDDAAIRLFIQRQLSKTYNVLLAPDGGQALDMLSERMVSLVVSDVMMPVMDGVELCAAIKSDFRHCHIPVILLTAKTMTQSKIEGAQAGADAYIEKPFSTEHLLAVIDNLIRSRDMLKKAFTQHPMAALSKVASITKSDEDFMQQIHDAILRNISNPELKMENIAETLNMSRASFYRKIKGLLDISPNEYLRIERLKEAARLLREGRYQVSEVCYMVGFNSLSYFSKCFHKQYGVLPRDFS